MTTSVAVVRPLSARPSPPSARRRSRPSERIAIAETSDNPRDAGITTAVEHLRAVGLTALLDAATAQAVIALRAASVRSILLKGPSVARWLYEDPGRRPYSDIDLLVSAADREGAERVLAERDFARLPFEAPGGQAQVWALDGTPVSVDLHVTLVGVGASDERAWSELSADTEELEVGGTCVEVLGEEVRALYLALHAAQHGTLMQQPLQDLERGLRRLPEELWWGAERVARQLDAVPAFAAGLRLVSEGKTVAAQLRLPTRMSVETALRVANPPDLSLGLERLATMGGFRARAVFIARKLVPHPGFMRAWSPLARRGTPGLALSYLWRSLWLLWRVGPALRAWRRARRVAR